MKLTRVLTPCFLALALFSCSKNKEPPADSDSDSWSVRIAAQGGTLEYNGAKFEFPSGALPTDTTVTLRINPTRPTPVDFFFKLVSASYTLEAGRWTFDKPLLVTLPFDPALLPEGVKAESVVPVIGTGGVYEPLRPRHVDVVRREVTFELNRLVPLQAYEGPTGGGQGQYLEMGVAGDASGTELVREGDDLELRAIPDVKEQVARKWDVLKNTLLRMRREYAALGFITIPKVRICFVRPPKGAEFRAETRGPELTLINVDLLTEPETELASTYGHECFHLVQHGSSHSVAMSSFHTILMKWPDESTASWMQYKFFPDAFYVRARSADHKLHDFQVPYFRWTTNEHSYSCFTFWCFVYELYGAVDVIKQLYPNPKDLPDGYKPFEEPVMVLDKFFRETPDRQGRLRSLADVFVDYLIHFCAKMDREPLLGVLADGRRAQLVSQLGEPGKPKFDSKIHASQEIPYHEGGTRKSKKAFDIQTGTEYGNVGWGIAKTCELLNKTKGNEKGDLELRVSGGKARLVVFPRAPDGLLLEPLQGESVTVPKWEESNGAVVWVVDLSDEGNQRLRLIVEMNGSGPVLAGAREMAGSFFRVHVHTKDMDLNTNKSDRGVLFTVYRAQSAEGPFEKVSTKDEPLYPVFGTPKPGEAAYRSVTFRMAPNHYQVTSPAGDGMFLGPFYWKVGVRWANGRNNPVLGPELLSAPMAPGKIFIGRTSLTERGYSHGEWQFIPAALCVDNQPLDFPGAHFILTTGAWTGHFWSPRKTKTLICGPPYLDHVRFDLAPAEGACVPFSPGEMVVRIKGEARRYAAELELKLPPAPAQAEMAKRLADQAARLKAAEERWKGSIEAAQAELNNARKAPQPDPARVQQLAARVRLTIADTALDRNRYQSSAAWDSFDWPRLMQLRKEHLLLQQEFGDAEMARIAGASDQLVKEQAARNQSNLAGAHEELARAALAAGQADVFEQAMNKSIELSQTKEGDESGRVGKLYKAMGDGVAMLTGDRSRAAAMFAQGRQLLLTQASAAVQNTERQNSEVQNRKVYPAWWPEGGSQ